MKKVILPQTVTSDNGQVVGQVTCSEWSKNGMDRLYVTVRFNKGSDCKCGFVDLQSGEVKFTTRGVDGKWAAKVEAAMKITEKA